MWVKKAFTMAEVLITLGVLGIVMAMTLPNLIKRHNEKVWLTQFQKVYTTIFQAYYSAYTEYGLAKDWGVNNSEEGLIRAYEILSPHLNIGTNLGFKKVNNLKYKDLDNTSYMPTFNNPGTSCYNFILSNGAIVGLTYGEDLRSNLLLVDINGNKKPNQFGKDVFYFSLLAKNKAPFVGGYSLWWLRHRICDGKTLAGWYSGGSCSLWVIATGNMDYLHREISSEEWQKKVDALLLPPRYTDGELK